MTFSHLIYRNLKNNLRKYGMYLFSVIFAVFTIYTFNALSGTKEILDRYGDNQLFVTVFKSFTVILLIFMFFYLKYINSHFMKQRKKEIATYSLFGMPSSKIGWMFFAENLVIGMIGIVAGIALGVLFFRLITLLFMNLIVSGEAVATVGFSFHAKAMIDTAVIFFLYFIVINLLHLRMIYRSKIVELFNASKTSEHTIKGSLFLLMLSILSLGLGYYLSLDDNASNLATFALPILFLVIIGTYFFFRSGIQIILTFLRKRKSYIIKQDRLLVLSSFRYKVKSNSFIIGTIAVVSAVAMTAISSVYCMYYSSEKNAREYNLYDIGYQEVSKNAHYYDTLVSLINEDGKQITDDVTAFLYPLLDYQVKQNNFTHATNNYGFAASEIEYLKQGIYFEKMKLYALPLSEYNEVLTKQKEPKKPYQFKDGAKAMMVIAYEWIDAEKAFAGTPVTFSNSSFSIEISEVVDSTLPIVMFGDDMSIVVLDDSLFEELKQAGNTGKPVTNHLINYSDSLHSASLTEAMIEKNISDDFSQGGITYSYAIYVSFLYSFGIFFFIGLFLGLVFLVTTATLLYFKVMSDVEEDKDYYHLLENIGMTKERKLRLIRRQILPIFVLPLAFAILHSIFAMRTVKVVLSTMHVQILIPSLIMFACYGIIYFLFAFITIHHYRRKVS